MGISSEVWSGAVLGAVLGSIVIPLAQFFLRKLASYWVERRPQQRLLEGIAKQDELCKIFVRDLLLDDVTLTSIDPIHNSSLSRLVGKVPNIGVVWPDAEGQTSSRIFNVLGQVGKTQNIELVRMSQDTGEWNSHVIVLGAQAKKSLDFYQMKHIAYRVDGNAIYDAESGRAMELDKGFDYGIILKVPNPFKTNGSPGIGFLVGGIGVLGTAAASYYFKEYYKLLGQDFGKDYFGVVVRAPFSTGEQAVERLKQWDKRFKRA